MFRISLKVPAFKEFVTPISHFIREILERIGDKNSSLKNVCYDIMLICQEACSNIVKHAYGEEKDDIEILMNIYDDRIVLRIRDKGKGFDLSEIEDPNPFLLKPGGYGLYIIKKLADEVSYKKHGDFNELKIVKRLE